MTSLEIKALPTEEKVRIMEAIWEDMRDRFDASSLSQPMLDLLRERRMRVERGEAQLLEWDKVKSSLGRG
jgi:hypothetical protein